MFYGCDARPPAIAWAVALRGIEPLDPMALGPLSHVFGEILGAVQAVFAVAPAVADRDACRSVTRVCRISAARLHGAPA